MSTVQVVSDVSFNELLTKVEQLSTPDLEKFVGNVLAVEARRRAPSLSKQETQLLQQINQGVPAEVRKRYRLLDEKLHDGTITSEEHQELSDIINRIELADAERIMHLIKLAQLRNTTVDSLMDQLGIRKPNYA
jgi:hypothetical protein